MIKVGVVEDHPTTLRGLAAVIDAHPGLELVAIASTYDDSCRWPGPLPSVVLLDLMLPGLHGPEAVAALRARGVTVLILSAFGRRDDVVAAMAAGASGYLTKQAADEEITTAIEIVARGDTYVSATLAGHLLSKSAGAEVKLTGREIEVLELLAQGETDAGIARSLELSVRTVHSHLASIRGKFDQVYGVRPTRTGLARAYLDQHCEVREADRR